MDKNRGLIIATILLFIFGTGTFVFANPSEEDYQNYATDKTGNGQNTTKKEEKEGMELLWMELGDAMDKVTNCYQYLKPSSYGDIYYTKFAVTRDKKILQYYKERK